MEAQSFNSDDLKQLKAQGISEEEIKKQLRIFENGIPHTNVIAPATAGNGIICLSEENKKEFISIYEKADLTPLKFVPASGAATRMFKLLHQFIEEYNPKKEDLTTFLKQEKFKDLEDFFNNIEKLPFFKLAVGKLNSTLSQDYSKLNDEQKHFLVKFILKEMNYSNLPKGLIPFHEYEEKALTPFEEHFNEAIDYALKNDSINIHFTIAKKHQNLFEEYAEKIKSKHDFKNKKLNITYSFQEKHTDTIAVDFDNNPFRNKDGKLFFRPGGHGALIENLNKIDADIVFIKNIDNVVVEKDLALVSKYKKVLAGILIDIQKEIFSLLKELNQQENLQKIKQKAEKLADEYFHQQREFNSKEEIKNFFNRPIRVCGMVINDGAPGGGPFWVKDENGKNSLQIVESAQIDDKNPKVKKILEEVTHFNPVDLVCGIKNYKGEKFNLLEFVNPNQGFITEKSVKGQNIKALELPGLWNGAMANWNTIFVEVPHKTFNPVKTVLDLLKPGHQSALELAKK